jgi:hypothetical protein
MKPDSDICWQQTTVYNLRNILRLDMNYFTNVMEFCLVS